MTCDVISRETETEKTADGIIVQIAVSQGDNNKILGFFFS